MDRLHNPLSGVLVFEPDWGQRPFFDRQLKRIDMQVYYATSLSEARAGLTREQNIALALVDLTSVEEGLLLIREVYEDFPFMQSVVIVPEDAIKLLRQAMNRGAADFLIKPLSEENFHKVLSNMMVSVHARREILSTRERFAAMKSELEIAGKIQHAMLPAPHLDEEKITLYASLIPAIDIGGDLYDYFFLDKNRLAFLIGDVSGKGISAALFMAVCRSFLRSHGLQKLSPARCLEKTNDMLCQNNDESMFVTIFYGILDLAKSVLSYANAGHNPPYILRDGQPAESLAKTGDMALGLFEDNVYHEKNIELKSGDIIYLYTDGIVEAMNKDYTLFGDVRLQNILNTRNTRDCEHLIEKSLEALEQFTGGMDQSDDITSMALKLT
jgi:sigma-B regulation protein RsbU (phosphoserine phosphatase)